MIKVSKNKSVKRILLAGFVLFVIVQVISYIDYVHSIKNYKNPPGLSISMFWTFGFPIPIFYGSYFRSLDQFVPAAAIVNLVVAILFCFIVSLVFRFVRSKISSRHIILK
jgi:hypothetical protein